MHVNNYYSLEQTVFNLLRSKRPVLKTSEDIQKYVDKLDAQTKKTCDFCQYKTSTAEDIFGRFVSIFYALFTLNELHTIETVVYLEIGYDFF
jgi:hypothetical protein